MTYRTFRNVPESVLIVSFRVLRSAKWRMIVFFTNVRNPRMVLILIVWTDSSLCHWVSEMKSAQDAPAYINMGMA